MMKNRNWHILPLLLLLLAMLTIPVQASEYRCVFDEAFLLSTPEAEALDQAAADISVRYGCGVYIVTLPDYAPYGTDVRNAAENYFLNHDLGLGGDDNGVLLMLSMLERDYALIAHGDLGNTAFTDYGKDVLSEAFLDDFRYDSWAAGFADYISGSEELLYAASTGTPVDVQQGSGIGMTLVMILLIPALIAGVACGIMAASMKSARRKNHANDYSKGIQITGRHDRFITRTVVRQKIESSSSSGGGTRINSGGFSGKSGKF